MKIRILSIYCLFAIILAPFSLFSSCCEDDSCYSDDCCSTDSCCFNWCEGWSAEFRIAWYSPSSHKFRKIYSNSLADYQIELSKKLFGNWDLWLDVDYATKKGHSTYFHDKTRITIVPIILGARYSFDLCYDFQLYLGAGVNYTFLRIHDDSHYVKKHVHKEQFGGTFKVGLKKYFCDCFFVDVFVDYFLQDFHFSGKDRLSSSSGSERFVQRHSANLSGFKIGAGIGYTF